MFNDRGYGHIDVADNAFGFVFKCHLPKVGFGINAANGKMQETHILSASENPFDQKWERPLLPVDYKRRRDEEKRVQKIEQQDLAEGKAELTEINRHKNADKPLRKRQKPERHIKRSYFPASEKLKMMPVKNHIFPSFLCHRILTTFRGLPEEGSFPQPWIIGARNFELVLTALPPPI